MILGLASALAAAACYGFGSILQAMAAARSESAEPLDAKVLARLVTQWRYVAGLGLDFVGFAAAVVALRTLPLFVVQAAVAGSVGVTALAASGLLHARLARRERGALLALLIGLVLLAAAGQPEHATGLSEPGPLLLLVAAVALGVISWPLTRSPSEHASTFLALGAGAAFGAVGVAARAFSLPPHWTGALGDPLLYAIVAHGVLATLLFASALRQGKVTTVAAVTFSAETIVPAIVGVAWLGDHARPGLAPVAIVGFGVTVVAAIALARFADPGAATPLHP